jgi:hypothetical protein
VSLEHAAFPGQVIAAMAVLGSFGFVSLQIRQSTQFQKLAAVDGLSAAIACINVKGIESPALGETLAIASSNWGAATREQRIVAHYFLFSYFKLVENAWYQRQAGVLEPAQWCGWEIMVRFYYHSPGPREVWWPQRHDAYSQPFQTYLSGTVAPRGFGSLNDLFGNRVGC